MQRIVVLLGSVLFASVMLAGCMPEDSRTALDWYPAADPIAPVHNPAPRTATVARPAPVKTAALDCPVPRARPDKPAWYTAANLPPPAPVTQHANFTPVPAGTLSFAWPLSGPVISDFGTGSSGERNDGINIAAPAGTPIHAAAAGEVSYAGNELRGYGYLVLIKHADGYVTAYAHAERLIVNRGEMVSKGQVIGYAGQTGDVSSPQLHFEIRKGVTPVNPHSILATNRAS